MVGLYVAILVVDGVDVGEGCCGLNDIFDIKLCVTCTGEIKKVGPAVAMTIGRLAGEIETVGLVVANVFALMEPLVGDIETVGRVVVNVCVFIGI